MPRTIRSIATPASLAPAVQLLDETTVLQAVHLRDDVRRPSRPRVIGLAADPRDEPVAQVVRREEEVVEVGGRV
jgi:hypothetical protein